MRAEWIIMADAAEVVNSKLYLMGGGWDRLVVNQPLPFQQVVSIAVSFEVDWNETNVRHQMEMRVEDEDAKQVAKIAGHIEAGRPAGIVAGQSQRIQLAFKLPLKFERAGSYVVTALIEDEVVGRSRFHVALGRNTRQQQSSG